MGIPSYFKKIIDDFPEIIKTKSFLKINFDNLFIDFNGCIHNCSNKLKSSNNIFKNNLEFEKELINEVIKYTDEIFDFIEPSSLFYISIDGIPPRSKMVQQRHRRFMGSWKKKRMIECLEKDNIKYKNQENGTTCDLKEEIINEIRNEWDSSAISPGTEFMKKLSSSLKKHFKNSQKYKSIQVILSDSLEEGEGEYKIFKYINENGKNRENEENIIHGLDADLIMLSLLQNRNIHLLREPIFFKLDSNENFIFLSIQHFKDILKQTYSSYFHSNSKEESKQDGKQSSKQDIIDYYVFICFLIGNDFIVNLTFLKFKNNSLEILLNIYKKVSEHLKQNILIKTKKENQNENPTFRINYLFLSKFINELSQIEDEYLAENTISHEKQRPFFKKEVVNNGSINGSINDPKKDFIKKTIKKYDLKLEQYPILNKKKDKINAGIDKNWRKKYYYYLFDTIDISSGDEIKDICHNYLESLEFTLDYYYHQTYHKTWYYRYQYSPTILDLSNYIQSINYTTINENQQNYNKDFRIQIEYNNLYPDIDITTNLQLLMILPPTSSSLLEPEYHKLMVDIDYEVLHYYPIDFDISIYLKKWLWLCKPKLPDIDIILLNSKIKLIS